MFTLPSGFVSGINTNATDFLATMSGPTTLILGVLLGVTAIAVIIRVFTKH